MSPKISESYCASFIAISPRYYERERERDIYIYMYNIYIYTSKPHSIP